MTDSLAAVVLLLHLAATLFMAWMIWFVQVVHYPLLARVGRSEAEAYEQAHTRRTRWVVGPPMLVELATGMLLLRVRPAGASLSHAVTGVALLTVVWLSTQFVQIPCHERSSQTFATRPSTAGSFRPTGSAPSAGACGACWFCRYSYYLTEAPR